MANLTIVALPIDGNWRELDPRVINAVRSADLLIAEEKKSALRLLAVADSRETPFLLLNEHSSLGDVAEIAQKAAETEYTVFVSDAGTPCIADPDYRLVDACIRLGIGIRTVPGPSSITAALSASGYPADSFIFLGFPPKDGSKRKAFFLDLTKPPRTTVFLERPYALEKTLKELGDMEISLSVDLGNENEISVRGRAAGLAEKFKGVKKPFAVVVKGSAR